MGVYQCTRGRLSLVVQKYVRCIKILKRNMNTQNYDFKILFGLIQNHEFNIYLLYYEFVHCDPPICTKPFSMITTLCEV